MTGRTPPSSPLWLHLSTRGSRREDGSSAWALVQAVGLKAGEDEDGRPTQVIHMLLVITDPQGAALLRRAMTRGDDEDELPSVAMALRRGQSGGQRKADLSYHIHLHPLVITRKADGGYVSFLAVPACADSSTDRAHSCADVMVVGRDEGELMRNAWRRLVARSSLPLHPSWETPVMAHLREVSLSWNGWGRPPLEFLEGEGLLQAAYLHVYAAVREIEKLCEERRLPAPAE